MDIPVFASGVVDAPGGKCAAGNVDTGGKFATSISDTSGTSGKFSARAIDTGIVETCGKFATGVP